MSILQSGQDAAKAAGTAAALDAVAKNKITVEADLKGNVEGAFSVTRSRLTFTTYVKALIAGPQKAVSGGVRAEVDLTPK